MIDPASTDYPHVLGLDIGGANLKFASNRGASAATAFPLWQRPRELAAAIAAEVGAFGQVDAHVVTMTGEMADCFMDRREGVIEIVKQCLEALGSRTLFYSVDGLLIAGEDAIDLPDHLAASNWHAIASLAARWCQGPGLLIDIGSTTTDLIPLADGLPRSTSRTDFDRLITGELVYLGIGRTPVCSLVDGIPFGDRFVPVMNEVFATMDDCAILTGDVDENPADTGTADGRPRTRMYAANRLARMIGLDRQQVTVPEATSMARYVVDQWRARIMVAAAVLSSADAQWILSGHGARLLQLPAERSVLDLTLRLGDQLSRCAPAYAVAILAGEKIAGIDAMGEPR
jgi:probable H4MPT-linked C1 transfer pathway protein